MATMGTHPHVCWPNCGPWSRGGHFDPTFRTPYDPYRDPPRLKDLNRPVISRRFLSSAVATAVLLAVIGWAIFAAVRADGFARTDLLLNDGGAWLVNRVDGDLAHVNGAVFEVDARIDAGAADNQLDVVQAPGFVLAHTTEGLVPVDVARLQLTNVLIGLPIDVKVSAGEGVVGVVDEDEGRVWRLPVGDLDESLNLDDEPPTLSMGGETMAVVGVDGAVHAASDSLITLDPAGGEREFALSAPVDALTSLGQRAVAISGDDLINFSGIEATRVPLDRRLFNPKLQQPGISSEKVFAATGNGEVVEIDRTTGRVIVLVDDLGTDLLPPVVLRGCVFTYAIDLNESVRICGGERVAWPVANQPTEPRLRLVNDRVWLDDPLTDLYAYIPLEGDQILTEEWAGDGPGVGEGDEGVGADSEVRGTTSAADGDGRGGLGRGKVLDDGVNEPPLARDDEVTLQVGQSGLVSVLANDLEPDGDVLGVVLEDPPEGFVVLSDQRVFIRAFDAPTTVMVGYRATDGFTESNRATIQVTVEAKAGNDPPIAVDDVAEVTVGSLLSFDVLYNDYDPNGDRLVLADVSTEAEGAVVTWTADGLVSFAATESGIQEVAYVVSDGSATAEGMLEIDVVEVGTDNRAPLVINDFVSTLAEQPIRFSPLINDTDPDGDQLTIQELGVVEPASSVSFELFGDNSVIASPGPDFVGSATVPYVVVDDRGAEATGLIRLEVGDRSVENRNPVVVDDSALLIPGESTIVQVLANDFDPDGDVLRLVEVTSDDALAAVVVDRSSVELTAAPDATGTVVLAYTVDDGAGGESVGAITVLIGERKNRAPVAVFDLAQVEVGSSVEVDVLANDEDPDGDELTVFALGTSSVGRLVLLPDNTVQAIAGPDDAGTISASYTIEDPDGARSEAMISVAIIADDVVNQPPIAVDDQVVTSQGEAVVIDVLANDTDPENDSIRVIDLTQPRSGGRAEITPSGALRVSPDGSFTGVLSFAYTIRDGEGGTDSANVRVRVDALQENRPPRAVADSATVIAGETVTIALLVNDTDPDPGDKAALRIRSVSDVANRVAVDGGQRSVRFTARDDDEGVQSFSYVVEDGRGGTDTGNVSVAVTRAEDDEEVVVDNCDDVVVMPAPVDVELEPGEMVSVDVVAEASYGDCDKSEIAVNLLDSRASLSGTTITYRASDKAGVALIVYELVVPGKATAPGVLRVTITSNTLPPEPLPDSFEIRVGTALSIRKSELLANDQGEGLRVTAVSRPVNGMVDLRPGSVLFVADRGATSGSFTYKVTDLEGRTSTAVVSIAITNADKPPRVTPAQYSLALGQEQVIDLADLVKDPEGEPLTIDLIRASGSVSISTAGTVVTVTAEELGEGVVTYQATDASSLTTGGRIVFVVSEAECAEPVAAANDTVVATVGSAVTVDVLANDTGEDATVAAASVVSGGGAVAVAADGTELIFTAPAMEGTSVVAYSIDTPSCGSADARVTIETSPISPPSLELSNLRVFDLGDDAAKVYFDANNCSTAKYVYTATDGSDSGVHQPASYPDPSVQCWNDHGANLGEWTPALKPATTYTVAITVIDTFGQQRSLSTTFTTTGGPVPTGWVTPPRVIATACTSITFNFETPVDASYLITWTPADGGGSANQGWAARNRDATVGGLNPGTTYTFRITATGAADGEQYGPVTLTATTESAGCDVDPCPDPLTWVTLPTQYQTSQTSVSLSFEASERTTHQMSWTPADAGGGTNQGTLFRAHQHQISGLQPGTSYTGTITLTNVCGESINAPLNFATSAPPCAAFGFTANPAASNVTPNSMVVSFATTEPSTYVLTYNGLSVTGGPASSHSPTLTGLTPSTAYSISVTVTAAGCQATQSVNASTLTEPSGPEDPPDPQDPTTTVAPENPPTDPPTTAPTTAAPPTAPPTTQTPPTTQAPPTTQPPGTSPPDTEPEGTSAPSDDPLSAAIPQAGLIVALLGAIVVGRRGSESTADRRNQRD